MKMFAVFFCFLFFAGSIHPPDGWQLVWSDEFDYSGLPDQDIWNYEEGFLRNMEMQYYTRQRKKNVRIENGILVIEAHKEEFVNPRYRAGSDSWQEQRKIAQYTSGSINTLGKAEFRYGRIEIRAKLPRGNGMWPAFWMMGSNIEKAGWPRCGEIDIMEYVGKAPDIVHANCHFADPSVKTRTEHKSSGTGHTIVSEPWNDFHIYAIEWDEKQITFFADGLQYSVLNIDDAGTGPDNPFRQPQYLLLNFALGGSWGGEIDDSMLPQKYEIDYVRVYENPGRAEN